jgi:hypothetical protein
VKWRHYGLAAAGLTAAVVATALLAPARVNPPTDPSLDVRAVTSVPEPVMSVLRRACMDCHSDATRWPWYSKVPPISWLVAHDVQEARKEVNFSRWGAYNAFDRADILDEACELVSDREMPLWSYRLLHARARLTDEDVQAFCTWTRAEAERLVMEGR